MSITQTRAAIASTINTALPQLTNVYTHGGRFTLEDLKRIAVRAPTALVACLGIADVENEGGQNVAEVQWGVFVVTAGTSQQGRDTEALTVVEAVANVVGGNSWQDSSLSYPTSVRAENLYSPSLDAQGMALWAITWRQEIDLATTQVTDQFETLYANYDLAPQDEVFEATDVIELEQPSPGGP